MFNSRGYIMKAATNANNLVNHRQVFIDVTNVSHRNSTANDSKFFSQVSNYSFDVNAYI